MLNKIVFDLETQKDFNEAGGRNKHHLLRVSVCVAYSYKDDQYYTFQESQINKLGELLQAADQIIGFNIKEFDYRVLQPYLNFELAVIPTLDILEEIEKVLGHRVRLDSVAQATLGSGKSGTGLQALTLWRTGRIKELIDYCRRDVEVTKQVYDFAQSEKKLKFQDYFEVREIPVNFPEAVKRENVVKQSSLF